jgi:serine/threonine-protein kinase
MNSTEQDHTTREQRLGEVFSDWLESRERGEVPARAEWLARYPDLAPELEELLADEDHLHALAAPLREAARIGQVAAGQHDLPGPFGDCAVLEEIGRGGMGVVYRARQTKLDRLVALKLFRAQPHSARADLERFRHEAEVVAQLDHPLVVPVYEVGEQQGWIWFTMKLVEGGGLDTQLPHFRTDPRAAARLLLAVARAVHHTHQRGILHRDLKPSNILLDREGQPHVSDFGLARRVGSEVGLTLSGAVVGTPAYMSPEQAIGRRGTVTTAADVYGLGAVLYALLTGKPPFQGNSVLETLEQVKERDPVPPRTLNPGTPRDLETICLKCLRKTPAQRYESAAGLADDLERWLGGEPIRARPVGPVETLWRWCRRQPVQAALAAALLGAVVLGVALIFRQWQRAEENYRTAESRRQEAEDRKAEALESLRMAHEVVRDFTIRVVVNGRLEEHGLEPLRLESLRKAQQYYRKFLERPELAPAVLPELAETSAALAEVLRRTGSLEDSLSAYQDALHLYEALVRRSPESAPLRLEQAKLHNHVGGIQGILGRPDDALASFEHAGSLLKDALRSHPGEGGLENELACAIHNRAMVFSAANRNKEALAAFAEAQAILDRLVRAEPDNQVFVRFLANTLNNSANVLVRQRRLSEALPRLQEAARLRERLVARFPDNLVYRGALGESLSNVADCLLGSGNFDEGVQTIQKATALLADLTQASPHIKEYRFQSALSQAILGRAYLTHGDPQKAIDPYEQARRILLDLAREQPNVHDYPARLEHVLLDLGDAQYRLNRAKAAQRTYEEARDLQTRFAETGPEPPDLTSRRAATLHSLALTLAVQNQLEDAHACLCSAVRLQQAAFQRVPGNAGYRQRLLGHHALQAQLERDLGQTADALDTAKRRLELGPNSAEELSAVARDFALTAAACKEDDRLQGRAVEQALTTLRLAVRAGLRDADRIRQDPAWKLISERAEFRKLLKEMASAGPESGAVP